VKSSYLSIILMLAAGFCRTATAADVLFIKEYVDFTILPPDTVEVRGQYFFIASDASSITPSLYYQFPSEGPGNYPFSITVVDKRTADYLNFDPNPQGILFTFSIENKDTAVVVITYKQKAVHRTGLYKMQTTSNWGRSFGVSKYSVRIPLEYTLSSLSFKYNFVSSTNTERSYHFSRVPSKIDTDIVFTWDPAANH
jgi:hypothetical protein